MATPNPTSKDFRQRVLVQRGLPKKRHHETRPGYSFPRSQLFSVRVWREELAENQHEWRGKVQHVASGEVFYFWPPPPTDLGHTQKITLALVC